MSLFQPVGRLPRVCGAPPCPEYHDGYVTSSTALEKIVYEVWPPGRPAGVDRVPARGDLVGPKWDEENVTGVEEVVFLGASEPAFPQTSRPGG